MLGGFGAAWSQLGTDLELDRLLDEDRVDLAVADVESDPKRLDGLLRALKEREERDAPPLILLARPRKLVASIRDAVQRFHVAVVSRPLDQGPLASAVRAALAIRDHQRQHRDLNARLRWAEAKVEELGRQSREELWRRTRLLTAISHTLRTPLNEMMLICQVLQQLPPCPTWPPETEHLIAGLDGSVGILRELVNDLVDIAGFDLGQLPYHEAVVPLGPFLERVLDSNRNEARQKGLGFEIEPVAPGLAVRADPDMLARVVQNLASNAVKFTSEGAVQISARTEGGRGLVLTIADTGRGIAIKDQGDIFDEFSQIENPARDLRQGTGLGLPICRRLVSALGGRIEVVSSPGQGSRFTIIMPPDTVTRV